MSKLLLASAASVLMMGTAALAQTAGTTGTMNSGMGMSSQSGAMASSSMAPAQPVTTSVTPNSPAFTALRDDRNEEALRAAQAAYDRNPSDPFAALALGTAFQRLGRMDQAEPLLRQALNAGRGVMPVAWTEERQRGLTVDRIACDNLQMGLPAAPASQARECQPQIAEAPAPAPTQGAGTVTEPAPAPAPAPVRSGERG